MDNIYDQILKIPAMEAFNAEPVPQLDTMPVEQRVQNFLAEYFGPQWYSASVFTYTHPAGYPVYAAFGPVGTPASASVAMHLVGEKADGSLGLATPLPRPDNEEEEDQLEIASPSFDADTERAVRNEQACLARILPALMEASNIVAAAEDVKPTRKKRLRAQIAHACKHLQINLENMRRGA